MVERMARCAPGSTRRALVASAASSPLSRERLGLHRRHVGRAASRLDLRGRGDSARVALRLGERPHLHVHARARRSRRRRRAARAPTPGSARWAASSARWGKSSRVRRCSRPGETSLLFLHPARPGGRLRGHGARPGAVPGRATPILQPRRTSWRAMRWALVPPRAAARARGRTPRSRPRLFTAARSTTWRGTLRPPGPPRMRA